MSLLLSLPLLLLLLLLLLSAGAGAYLLLNRVADRSVADLSVRWAPPPSQFIDVLGVPLHFRDEGPREDGLPIVLLHGTSASLHTWDGWASALSGERRVIRFDLPAFGLTGPSPSGDYSVESYVQTLIAFLDSLHVHKCVLVGNSLGGHVSWVAALLHPARVERLVLIDAVGYPFQPKSVPIGLRIANTPILNQLMKNVLPRAVVESSVKNVYANPSLVTPALVDRYFDLITRAGNREALALRMRRARLDAFSTRVSEINVPTLIMWGAQDRLVPPEIADRFHADLVKSTLVIFDALGHVPHEEDPLTTSAALKRFLALQTS